MLTSKFRKVKELRETYCVFAHFYNSEKNRLFADIVRRDCWKEPILPDAYVVMINPGSCKKNATSEIDASMYPAPYSYQVIEAISDPAMKCVMWLMDSCKLKKVRILNLVDTVNPKYAALTDELFEKEIANEYLAKSIFSDVNDEKYRELVSDDACFFIAWGLDRRFDLLKAQALKKIALERIVNISEDGISYRYIKPMNYNRQKEISQEYTEQYWKWVEKQKLR